MRLSGVVHTVAHCLAAVSIAAVSAACDNGPLEVQRLEVVNANNRFIDWYSAWADEILIEEPLPARAQLRIGFNELVDVERAADTVLLVVRDEDLPLALTLEHDGSRGMRVTPDEPMPNGAELQLSLSADLPAWDGEVLGRPFVVDFRVREEQPVPTE
ncbi:MAG: hypothetical protein KTR31_18120 [Myxococcales bacterium]|nr:hypothetical protein [Myxococcales bacterium]